MRKRIVIWGTDENDDKVLLALDLLDKENKVNIYLFPEEDATEVFYTQMMNMWRDGQEVVFPESTKLIERDLSVTEDLLPMELRVDRPDIISLAKSQWHFIVLSTKLYSMYKSELEDLKEQIDKVSEFDGTIWEELKTFWTKVNDQLREKHIFREHADSLKNKTDEAFAVLKQLKKKAENELREESSEIATEFYARIKEIDERIEKGLGLNPIFEELKQLQKEFKELNLFRKDQQNLWNAIDSLFKKVKEKKHGKRTGDTGTSLNRVERRYEGLVAAIEKMERSIKIDIREIDFQKKRIDQTDGQLEAQIRQAKIKMLEEKVSSKQTKLDDMIRTREILESKLVKEKVKEEDKFKAQEVEKAKEIVKQKIAEEIAEQSEKLEEQADVLSKAANDIIESKPKKEKKTQVTSEETREEE